MVSQKSRDTKRNLVGNIVLDGSLAQSVEQLTFNQLVAGSNPARLTTDPPTDSVFPGR